MVNRKHYVWEVFNSHLRRDPADRPERSAWTSGVPASSGRRFRRFATHRRRWVDGSTAESELIRRRTSDRQKLALAARWRADS